MTHAPDITIRPVEAADLPQVVTLDRLAFAPLQSNETIQQQWYNGTVHLPGRKLFLAVEGELGPGIGTYAQLALSTFLEGQELPLMGIAAVAVAPHRRGQRIARLMLEHALKDAKAQQIPIMALYPFQHGFYRRLGWAWVEQVHQYRVSPRQLPPYEERSHMLPTDLDQHLSTLKKIYLTAAAQHNGWLKRQDWQWESWAKPVAGREIYVYQEAGQIQGYVVLRFTELVPQRNIDAVSIQEWVALTPSAYRGILGFLASLRDQISTVIWTTFPSDPFPHLLMEQRQHSDVVEPSFDFGLVHQFGAIGGGFMWRLTDISTAFQLRPIQSTSPFAISVQITDPIFGQQSIGAEFSEGRINLLQTLPTTTLKLSVEHLTQLFCGVRRSRDLLWTGELELEGNDTVLAHLDQALQTEPPFGWDFF
jgi:predicted acetyltransferase